MISRLCLIILCVNIAMMDFCLSTTTADATTTLKPLDERRCMPGFVCVHGACDRSVRVRCVCDNGWTGAFCTRNKCQCEDGTPCVYFNGRFSCPNSNKTMSNDMKDQTSPYSTNKHRITPTAPVPNNVSMQHACSADYAIRPLKERQCLSNFVCKYGVCKMIIGPDRLRIYCVCDRGGRGGLCQEKCCKDCSQHGHCITSNGSEFCRCFVGYKGKNCEVQDQHPENNSASIVHETSWYYYVIGICAAVIVILFVPVVVLLYYMWRNKVPLVMKLVHYWQPYEDNDNNIWDAFVSYKSCDKDERFVLQTLLPKLEHELGFMLCLHFRDFPPGYSNVNAMTNAVKNSRRTILILTPRYIESELTSDEYQAVQQELLKQKHRILPILLEDISYQKRYLDPTFKNIINAGTFLEYPAGNEKKLKRFWMQMELSLPKKRLLEKRDQFSESSISTSTCRSTCEGDSPFSNKNALSISTIKLDLGK